MKKENRTIKGKKNQNKKNKFSDILYIFNYYKKYKLMITLILTLCFIFAGISVILPLLEGKLIALFNLSIDINYDEIFRYAIGVLIFTVLLQVITHIWSYLVLTLNSKVDFDIKKSLLNNIMKFKISNFDKSGIGTFITRITTDAYTMSEMFDAITDYSSTVLYNIGFVIYASIINPIIGIYMIIYIGITYKITSISNKKFKTNTINYKKAEDTVVSSYNNILRGFKDIKNLGLEKNILPKVEIEQYNSISKNKKTIHTRRSFARFNDFIMAFLNFGLIILSVYLIKNGSLSVANFIIIFLYFSNLKNLIKTIILIREEFSKGEVAAKRLREVLEYDGFLKQIYGNINIEEFIGNIEFKNVKFGYSDNNILFNNLSFKIKANTMNAFVGKSGER